MTCKSLPETSSQPRGTVAHLRQELTSNFIHSLWRLLKVYTRLTRAYMAKTRWTALELYRYPPKTKPEPEPQCRHTISEPLKGKNKTKKQKQQNQTKTTTTHTGPLDCVPPHRAGQNPSQLAPPVTVTTEPRGPDSYATQLSSPQAVAHPENEVPWDSHVLTVCQEHALVSGTQEFTMKNNLN